MLKEALIATAINRETVDEVYDYIDVMNDISTSKTVISSWDRYQHENAYAQAIELNDIFKVISNILNLLKLTE